MEFGMIDIYYKCRTNFTYMEGDLMLKYFLMLTAMAGMLLMAGCGNGGSSSPGSEPEVDVSKSATDEIAAESLDFASDIQPVIKQHCFKCHDAESKTHGVNLEMITGIETLKSNGELAEELVEVLSEKKMPPKSMPAPTDEEYAKLLAWVKSSAE